MQGALWLLEGSTQREPKSAPTPAATGSDERWWVCRHCAAPITPATARLEVDGTHVHLRENPVGRVFLFGCFRIAPGVRTVGPPSAEATWFTGYGWTIAVCGGCHAHLGWRYQGRDPEFYGLILDQLAEQELPRA